MTRVLQIRGECAEGEHFVSAVATLAALVSAKARNQNSNGPESWFRASRSWTPRLEAVTVHFKGVGPLFKQPLAPRPKALCGYGTSVS